VRIGHIGNNRNDFVGRLAFFDVGQQVIIELDVVGSQNIVRTVKIIEDDDNLSGVQIRPVAGSVKNITVISEVMGQSPHLQFLNDVFQMQRINGSLYSASISLSSSLAAGNYSILLVSGDVYSTLQFTYLPLKKFSVQPLSLKIKGDKGETISESVRVKNLGNIALNVSFGLSDFKGLNSTISSRNVRLAANSLFELLPGETQNLKLLFDIPLNVSNGLYRSVMRFTSG